ncbi:MAG: Gfo/Idh/MocA family oxidoreductase [Candidatus Omnitrophica bacterium]|nr:Gfo/Idh/MocA family oxidoreductase [Candidatus Omnitrophota bacterium]
MRDKVRIGFIGCGGIAGAHLARLEKLARVELVSFCDPVLEKATRFSKTYGGKAFTDYREMLENVSLDACFICVPPFAHGAPELLCAEKEIPFFVEKPVALNLATARQISEVVRRKNLITAVGYVLRAYDTVSRAKELLAGEKIGLVRGKYYGCVPGAGQGWYSQKSLSGGQLVEQATHTVDMMRYLAGEVEEVFGYSFEGVNRQFYEKYDVEDASATVMRFANGAVGNLACTWLWTGYHSAVEVIARGMVITLEGASLTVDRAKEKCIYTSQIDPMMAEDESFIAAVENDNPDQVKANYEEGVKSLAVSLATLESFKTGKVVKVLSFSQEGD